MSSSEKTGPAGSWEKAKPNAPPNLQRFWGNDSKGRMS